MVTIMIGLHARRGDRIARSRRYPVMVAAPGAAVPGLLATESFPVVSWRMCLARRSESGVARWPVWPRQFGEPRRAYEALRLVWR
jgi:hypothetical protein